MSRIKPRRANRDKRMRCAISFDIWNIWARHVTKNGYGNGNVCDVLVLKHAINRVDSVLAAHHVVIHFEQAKVLKNNGTRQTLVCMYTCSSFKITHRLQHKCGAELTRSDNQDVSFAGTTELSSRCLKERIAINLRGVPCQMTTEMYEQGTHRYLHF